MKKLGWLGAFRGHGRERVRDGKLERQCRKCCGWFARERFAANRKCPTGRTNECNACRQERRLRHAA